MYQFVGKTVALALVFGVCVTAQPVINNTSGIPECTSSTECSSGKDCIKEKCVDPCDGACGQNTLCYLVDLVPMCACKLGFTGHPFTGCTRGPGVECLSDIECAADKACVMNVCVNPCHGACGINADCTVIDHRSKCACLKGFQYNPSVGCVPIDLPDCKTSAQCPGDRACVSQKCVDPCEGVCGNNTVCHVTNHYPACACSPGFTGDAFSECKPLCLPLSERKKRTGTTNKPGLKKKFTLSTIPKKWSEAAADCLSQDMALAAIEDEEEQKELENYIGIESGVFYTSGWSDKGVADEFEWTTTGNNLLPYNNWLSDEPSGEENHCLVVLLSNDCKWQSNSCSERRRFICQYYDE